TKGDFSVGIVTRFLGLSGVTAREFVLLHTIISYMVSQLENFLKTNFLLETDHCVRILESVGTNEETG
ncbi:MAG: hypothetical protein OXI86_01740, partial [Candidatus Poribacteria bacterium]|nr:hypothetical protein [Candidatus Poribacteria bacterium]